MFDINLAIVIITNGKGNNLQVSLKHWQSQFELGKELFVCGPEDLLSAAGILNKAIIDYQDVVDSYSFFRINQKKYVAGNAIEANYIYFVHDRFYPTGNFKQTMEDILDMDAPDFGAVDVLNQDNSLGLAELRVRNITIDTWPVEKALLSFGRLVCMNGSVDASNHIAINGGQFFLKKQLVELLKRPLRWVEMEDDILSYDLMPFKGVWVTQTALYSLNHRKLPQSHLISKKIKVKFGLYGYMCRLSGPVFRLLLRKLPIFTTGQLLSQKCIDRVIDTGGCYVIDPLHKIYATDLLPMTVEKLISLCRLNTNGISPQLLVKTYFGWHIVMRVEN